VIRSFIEDAHAEGACVLFITSPYSMPPEFEERLERQRTIIEGYLGELAASQGAAYVSFNEFRYEALRDPALFIDTGHLNRDGARLLTSLVADEVERLEPTCRPTR
jgi:lysophospholipase L1-like esterase